MKIDELLLLAYVDGELDEDAAGEVEASLAADEAARNRVQALRESAALARAAFNDISLAAVPPRLVAAATLPTSAAGGRGWMYAVAASIAALVIGFGGGMYLPGGGTTAEPAAYRTGGFAPEAKDQAIREALNTMPSGAQIKWTAANAHEQGRVTLIRTYRNKARQYCREFRDETTDRGKTSVAFEVRCHTGDGRWKPRYRLIPLDN